MRKVVLPLAATGVAVSATLIALASCGSSSSSSNSTPPAFNINSINHVVVIYQENWSFDALYGQFPGANGTPFGTAETQTLINGSPVTAIPHPLNYNDGIDTVNFSTWPTMAPQLYNLLSPALTAAPDNLSTSTITGDIVHRFYIEQWQIDGGLNDRFIAWSDNPGLCMSGYDATNLPEGKLAQQYVLCDNFYHSAFGGSFLNHQYLISAQAPVYGTVGAGNAPIPVSDLAGYPAFVNPTGVTLGTPGITPSQATIEANAADPIPTTGEDWPNALAGGSLNDIQDGQLLSTADANAATLGNGNYMCINTMYPAYWPFPTAVNGSGVVQPSGKFVPPQTHKTIGDLLTSAGQPWKWYSEGWNDAVAGNPDVNFQYHHQAFNYYAQFAPGTPGRVHLADLQDLDNDLALNTLPAVSFVKFLGENNEHPGYSNIITGQNAVADLVAKIQNSPAWNDTAIFITYDEHGGHWDHVNPLTYPNADAWGPGLRVPCIIVSPYAKPAFIDHTAYETVSILSFIEKRWSLGTIPGATRDATANPFSNVFQGVPMHTNNVN
jgi:phospholipase C